MKTVDCVDCSLKMDCNCAVTYKGANHSHFGIGAIRCIPCGVAFGRAWRAKEKAEEQARLKHHLASNHEDGETCPECCEHGDIDDGQCLDCGTDLSADIAAIAYDRAKDARKYGDT